MSRLKNKPFEILAISLDDAREILVHMLGSMKMPGIQTWDEKGRENPIATLYNAVTLPTWYLLDENGVIRARDPFGEQLIPAVTALLARSKTTNTRGGALPDPKP